MEKDHGKARFLLGHFIKDIGVVHMGRGPFPRRIVVTDVKGSRRMEHGPAGRKDALFLDLKGFCRFSERNRAKSHHGRTKKGRCKKLPLFHPYPPYPFTRS